MKEDLQAVIVIRGIVFTKPIDFDYKPDLVGDIVWVPLNKSRSLKARLRNESTDNIVPRMLLFELVPESEQEFLNSFFANKWSRYFTLLKTALQ